MSQEEGNCAEEFSETFQQLSFEQNAFLHDMERSKAVANVTKAGQLGRRCQSSN